MAASGEGRPRRGPAPIASFDHDVSDESSPESKQPRLAEIRERSLAPPAEGRARSHSSPGLGATPAPRIDISRASSSSHHDSRDSSPELALFAGAAEPGAASLGFREDGAAELRSSTEELAFLEPAPAPPPPPPASAPPPPRRHSRKDSQGSEAALLGAVISGRTSRLSSVGSQCSAQSALSALSHASHVSRLSVVSGVSRSPSPHKMLLETSFCGPKPIETDPEICAAVVEEHLLEIAKLEGLAAAPAAVAEAAAAVTLKEAASGPIPAVVVAPVPPADARDRREVRTEVTVEAQPRASAPPPVLVTSASEEKQQKESRNRVRAEERRARSRERREPSQPEVYKARNRSKDIIRIKLKPDTEYDNDDDDDDDDESEQTTVAASSARKPESLALGGPGPRSPSPAPAPPSRKSSFCSLFKSRETIASPDSPSDALRRKKSLNEGRSRSKSRERSAPPSSSGKLRGSVLSLFKTPRRSGASPSPSSRAASPGPGPAPPSVPPPAQLRGLKYYEDSRDGIIHIPLRTPPDDEPPVAVEREPVRPASAPCARTAPAPPTQRTVLPDGSIIIPLHSPTERQPPSATSQKVTAVVEPPPPVEVHQTEAQTAERRPEPQPRIEPESRSAPSAERVRPEPEPPPTPATPGTAAGSSAVSSPGERALPDATRSRRKERLVFTTNVGSTEQVFSTQFSITKTPSVTSEISESFPSFAEEARGSGTPLRDTHIAADSAESPGGAPRDSSESDGSSDAGAAAQRPGDAEARGLVVQESFEEELPYVPTTLPQERSLALPMLPVRERTSQLQTTASVERPRSAVRSGPGRVAPPPLPPAPPPPPTERLRIRLPRRASASAHTSTLTSTGGARPRTESVGDGMPESRKSEWIDFSEVPERRKAARRIQTVPAAVEAPEPALSYVEPDQCRCECHRAGDADDRSPGAPPFRADLDVREEDCS